MHIWLLRLLGSAAALLALLTLASPVASATTLSLTTRTDGASETAPELHGAAGASHVQLGGPFPFLGGPFPFPGADLRALLGRTGDFDLHDRLFPGSETCAPSAPAAVPEPSTLLLLGGGLAGFVVAGRARRSRDRERL